MVREHLANERTLPSWVKTGVNVTSFGLAIEGIGAQVSPRQDLDAFWSHRPSSAARRL